jgi:peptide/nickel transport system permease protein
MFSFPIRGEVLIINITNPVVNPEMDANVAAKPLSAWGRTRAFWSRLVHIAPLSACGLVVFILFLCVALFGPLLTPYDPIKQDLPSATQPPSLAHPFGTDNFGRDILSRVIYGTRNIFLLTGTATTLAVVLGTLAGLIIGYIGGMFDELVMRLFDALLAMPAFLLSLLLLGVFGPTRWSILLATVVLYVPIVTRVVRSVVIDIRTKSYVEAAETQGESIGHVLFREIFPAVLPILTVESALRFSYAIFLVSSLSFLGLGVTRPEPEWGLMVSEARDWYQLAPWMIFYPSAAIVVLVVSINLMTDGLRRMLEAGERT